MLLDDGPRSEPDPDQPDGAPFGPLVPEVRPPGRRRLLLVAAAVPWMVLAATALHRAPDAAARPAVADAAAPAPVVAPSATDPAGVPATGASATAAVTARTAGVTATTRQAEAIALVVARAALTGAGPRLTLADQPEPEPGRYLEHLVVEAVEMPAPGAAVVSVVATLLVADASEYDRVVVERWAVPVALDGAGAHPAGAPWPLPPPDLTVVTVTGVVDDADATVADAADALRAAGYREIEVHAVARSDGWVIAAEVTAVAPGERGRRRRQLWLRRDLDGLVLAGAHAALAAVEVTP